MTLKDYTAELTAIWKAKAILLKKFALEQASVKVQDLAEAWVNDEDPKSRALQSIEQLGRKLHITASVSLAYREASDPFGKVRSMIEDMIAKLLQEAVEGGFAYAMDFATERVVKRLDVTVGYMK